MIIGLTGTLSSGKGTVATMLKEHGFQVISFGDEVRSEAITRGIPQTRENLQILGARLRIEADSEVWCRRLEERMREGLKYVIDGVRYFEDDVFFRRKGNYKLISVDAPIEKRYEWSKLRNRAGDATKSFEQFKIDNDFDLGLYGESNGQNVAECIKIADYHIWNSGNRVDLRNNVESFLSRFHYCK